MWRACGQAGPRGLDPTKLTVVVVSLVQVMMAQAEHAMVISREAASRRCMLGASNEMKFQRAGVPYSQSEGRASRSMVTLLWQRLAQDGEMI
jgi:hypothetical protein